MAVKPNLAEPNTTTPPSHCEINGSAVFFEEDWHHGIGGGLWSTGSAMARYFSRHTDAVRSNLQRLSQADGRRIRALELGSGNGFLAACLAAAAGDLLEELVVTDLSDHLPLMRRTIDANAHIMERVDGGGSSDSNGRVKTTVSEHRWGEFDRRQDGSDCSTIPVAAEKFDFIFGSDLAYRDELHGPLISSIAHFSHVGTVALVGVTMNDTKPAFFEALREAGFRYERLADWLLEPEFRGTTFGLFAIRRAEISLI